MSKTTTEIELRHHGIVGARKRFNAEKDNLIQLLKQVQEHDCDHIYVVEVPFQPSDSISNFTEARRLCPRCGLEQERFGVLFSREFVKNVSTFEEFYRYRP